VTDMAFHILGIPGSLRRASYNRGLIRAAQELAPGEIRVESFNIGQIPLYNQDVEDQGEPDPVRALKQAMRAADALLFGEGNLRDQSQLERLREVLDALVAWARHFEP